MKERSGVGNSLSLPIGHDGVCLRTISPSPVELRHADKNKSDYLAWVHDLGRYKVAGKTLIASLKKFENISFWWMTAIAAKSPFEADYVYTFFKLRELDRLYSDRQCTGMIYCGNDRALHQTLRGWCREMGHSYVQHRIGKTRELTSEKGVKRWLRKLPFWFQALAHLTKKWYLRYRHVNAIHASEARSLKKHRRYYRHVFSKHRHEKNAAGNLLVEVLGKFAFGFGRVTIQDQLGLVLF